MSGKDLHGAFVLAKQEGVGRKDSSVEKQISESN